MSGSRIPAELAWFHLPIHRLACQLRIPLWSWIDNLPDCHGLLDWVWEATATDVQAYTSGCDNHLPRLYRPHLRRGIRPSQRYSLLDLRDHRVPRVHMVHALLHPLRAHRGPQVLRLVRCRWHSRVHAQTSLRSHFRLRSRRCLPVSQFFGVGSGRFRTYLPTSERATLLRISRTCKTIVRRHEKRDTSVFALTEWMSYLCNPNAVASLPGSKREEH